MPTASPERPVRRTAEPGPVSHPGRSPALTSGWGPAAVRIGALTVCQAALMVGLGLLITGPAAGMYPLSVEDHVNESLEHLRNGALNDVSLFASEAGNTATVIITTVLVCAGLILIPRLPKWREAVFLAVSVSLQALVFLVITTSVDRDRPDVDRLDASPPTASYTSGHTGAATALYGGLAVLALSRIRGPWRKAVGGLLLLIPLLVAVARLYRGMHHPSDVLGGLLNGGLSLLIVGRHLMTDGHSPAPAPSNAMEIALKAAEERAERVAGHTVVIVNPTVTEDAQRDGLRLVLEQHGHHAAEFVTTTADDPGGGQASAAIEAGASLVVVCGGDGTVRAAADSLAGTGVPLAVVPCGTGNLLARNLGLPLRPADALAAALSGRARRIDIGRIEGDCLPATRFTAMAGAGLDAAMLENTGDRAKSAWGWPAYVVAGVSSLRAPRMSVAIRLDSGPVLHRTARMVLLANIGKVQGGAALVPAAEPDDGLIDLAVFDPHGPTGWLRTLGILLRGRSKPPRPRARGSFPPAGGEHPGTPVEYFAFRRAELRFASEQSREIDGDPVSPGRLLVAEVEPGALTVLLPSGDE
ncbi:diacylglycerol kinase family protein [Streptomyces poriferorum]|uniref:Diacylglycerol kinase family protein n=1 Tax=Streptomyces poriferorum TaxID=2798799 RepID=A0ABY9IH48_9ACTN|nr:MULTISPECIES: diacylglycerol kinase family protein [unclassified Streptomyces]MDP5315832.1 diacylglycerol kinase family protein [Streptomyces sp. Alt4]WLQ54184.1 diacylglycerol kinase family protein [Streptomyces sp. Alt2]